MQIGVDCIAPCHAIQQYSTSYLLLRCYLTYRVRPCHSHGPAANLLNKVISTLATAIAFRHPQCTRLPSPSHGEVRLRLSSSREHAHQQRQYQDPRSQELQRFVLTVNCDKTHRYRQYIHTLRCAETVLCDTTTRFTQWAVDFQNQ